MYSGHPDWMIEREGKGHFASEPISRERLRALEAALVLTAGLPPAAPAARPAPSLRGSASLTVETPEPAGVDVVGRENGKAA